MKVLFITLSVVILDQLTKFLVKGLKIESLGINFHGMSYGSSKPVFGEFIKITFIENPGMAFGLDVGPKMFLTIFTIAASVVIFFYIYKHRNDGLLIRLALAFILAGAIGNLIDRTFYGLIYHYAPLFFGRVVDFVQVDVWDFTLFGKTYTTWPIFNVADVSVTVGFMIILFFHKRVFKREHDEDNSEPVTGGEIEPGLDSFSPSENQINTEEQTGAVSISTVNNSPENNLHKIEDPKEHSDLSSARSEEASDR